MHKLRGIVAFIGRLFLGAIFLITAVCELLGWPTAEQFFLTTFSRWTTLHHNEVINWLAVEVPAWSMWIVLGAILLKLLGALMLILGWHLRLGAVFLLVFLVPTTIIMHDFWHLAGSEGLLQTIMFLKNLAIVGGLLLVLALHGNESQHKEG